MADKGGQTTQAGIDYQNKIAALFLGRMIHPGPWPVDEEIIEVRNEDPVAEVDDVVLTYRDHTTWIQVKLDMPDSGKTWSKFWKHMLRQRWSADFKEGDWLVLVISQTRDWVKDLESLCEKAVGSQRDLDLAPLEEQVKEWEGRLAETQKKLLQKIVEGATGVTGVTGVPGDPADPVPAAHLTPPALFELFDRLQVWLQFNPNQIESDLAQAYMPQASLEWRKLFRHLLTIAADSGRYGKAFSRGQLIHELAQDDIFINPVSSERPPIQLLKRVKHFKDREKVLAKVLADLQPGAVVEVCGPGGMGKTALAAEALGRLTKDGKELPEAFPDGVILHSFYNQPEVDLAYEHIVRSYGRDPKPTPKSAAIEVLSGKRAVLLLDGAERAKGLQDLLDVLGRCAALVTTRQKGQGTLDFEELEPLELQDAAALLQDLAGLAGDKQKAINKKDVETICELVGRLPMAIVLAGSYLKECGMEAGEYARWLERSPLKVLDLGERRMESVNVLLEKSLGEVSELARQALGVVGLLALAPFQKEWVEAGQEESAQETDGGLGELVRFSLLRRSEGWYQVSHALVHTYARQKVDPPEGADQRLGVRFIEIVEEENARGVEGYRRLDGMRAQVVALVEQLAAAGSVDTASSLAWAIYDYLDRQGYPSERIKTAQAALTAAQAGNDPWREGAWLGNLGNAYANLGQVERAIEHYEQALAITRQIGDRRGEGAVLGNLGNAYADLGQVERVIEHYEQALAIAREIEDRRGEGNHLGNLGEAYAAQGQFEKARVLYQKALELSHSIGDRRNECCQLNNLGNIFRQQKEKEKAMRHHQQALSIARETGNRGFEEEFLGDLGLDFYEMGKLEQAIECYQQGLEIAKAIKDRKNEGKQLENIGNAFDTLGQVEKACANWKLALRIFEEIKSPTAERVRGWLEDHCGKDGED